MSNRPESDRAKSLLSRLSDLENYVKLVRAEHPGEKSQIPRIAEVFEQLASDIASCCELAEQSSAAAGKKYQRLFEVAGDALFIENENDEIVDANRRACELLGYSREELLTKRVSDLQAPEVRGEHGGVLRSEIARFRGRPFETLDLKKDGTTVPVEVTNTRLEDQGLYLSIVRDISERKELERARLEIHNIVEKSPLVFFVWKNESDWPIEFASHNVSRVFGFAVEDLLEGKIRYRDMVHPDDVDRVAAEVDKFSRDPLRVEFTHEPYRVVTAGGAVRWVSDQTQIRRNSRGLITHYQGVVTDITEHHHMETEILKMEKLQSLGVLAGGIAHDFNNFLTGIIGNLSLARMDLPDDGPVNRSLHEMEKAALRAKDLTQQLLTFSRGGEPIRKTTDISELLSDCAEFAMSGSNVTLAFDLQSDLHHVRVDPGQIAQVFNNLLINAKQSMPDGGEVIVGARNLRLTVPNEYGLGAGSFIEVSVRDHGSGIDPQNIPRVFDPYFTTKRVGSGLGLAVAHSIVTKHGGQMTVESKPGWGTKFTLVLAASEEQAPEKRHVPHGSSSGSGRVLVMDDEEFIRSLAVRVLGNLGYDVETATDGQQAINLYSEALKANRRFDVVLLDLTVRGGMGGLEAFKALKGIDQSVCAVVSSGYSNDPVMANYVEHGFAGIAKKPYLAAEIHDILQQAIAGSKTQE